MDQSDSNFDIDFNLLVKTGGPKRDDDDSRKVEGFVFFCLDDMESSRNV